MLDAVRLAACEDAWLGRKGAAVVDYFEMLMHVIMRIPYVAVLLVNKNGQVIFINETYQKILKRRQNEIINRHIDQVIPDSPAIKVLQTRKEIIGYHWSINGYYGIASCMPLIKEDQVVGCLTYSVFADIFDGKQLLANLINELNMYKNEISSFYSGRYTLDDIIGESPSIQHLKTMVKQMRRHSDTTVLITGETGTGKELFAHAIHSHSNRSQAPLVRINCTAIPENLLEAELFGYDEGAYTGAKKEGRPGKFEVANGGTVFLDEIGEMSLNMQSKLLVVLQEKEVERLGGNKPIKIDVRILAATNRKLEEMVITGQFREDLYYRLNVIRLEIPPLRKRPGDIPVIVKSLMPKLNKRLTTRVNRISPEALGKLSKYHWPGNVRELENMLERAMLIADMAGARAISTEHLGFINTDMDAPINNTEGSLYNLTAEFERRVLSQVLEETGNDKLEAARRLEIDLSSLYRKLKKHGISVG